MQSADGASEERRGDGSGLVPLMDLLNHNESYNVSAHESVIPVLFGTGKRSLY